MNGRPASTHDLRHSELRFLAAIGRLGFGRFEFVRIENGEVLLDPWPTMVHQVKFGAVANENGSGRPSEFNLKQQVVELFEYVRAVEPGEIRTLEIRGGLPFSMEIEHTSDRRGVHA
jgi:hypothetical protein